MLFMDDPDHRRIRSLVVQAFTRRATACARERGQQIVDEILDKMAAVDEPVDIISWLDSPFPITVIAEIRNRSSRPWRFQTLVRRRCIELRPDARPRRCRARGDVVGRLRAYLADALRRGRIDPCDDLISTLIAVQDADGDQLSDDEAVSAIALLLLAGNITTTDLIGNGLLALLQHPDQLDALRAATSLIDNAVEEMLRYDPPVLAIDRIAMAEMSIGGCPYVRVSGSGPCSIRRIVTRPCTLPRIDSTSAARTFTMCPSAKGRTCASALRSRGWRLRSRWVR